MSGPVTSYPVSRWADAPLAGGGYTSAVSKEPTVATQCLLGLMLTGATDRAIARELDVSLRTLHRRIARLQSLLGVQSRFQLGVLAAELEWLAAPPAPRAACD